MPARKKSKPVATPEIIAKAKKLKGEGKSYKEIATALGYKYDKAAWNLLNPGPTGRHRGDKGASKPSGKVQKGKKGAGKAKAAEGSVEARRTVKKPGKKAPQSPAKAPEESALVEGSGNQSGSLTKRFGQDRPVAHPSEPNGGKEEVRAVPKPKDRSRSK